MLVAGDAEGYVNFFRAPPPPPSAESAPVAELCSDLMHVVLPLTPEEASCELYPGFSSSETTAAAQAGLAVLAPAGPPAQHPHEEALSSADSFPSLIPVVRIGPEEFSKELDPASSASSSSSSSGDSIDINLQAGIFEAAAVRLEAPVSTEAAPSEGLILDEATLPSVEGNEHPSCSGSSNGMGHSAAAAMSSVADAAAAVIAAAPAHQEGDHQLQPSLQSAGLAASEGGSEDEALIPPSV
jgi:hypothetical protein